MGLAELESFVKESLGDAGGHAVRVGRSFLDSAGNPINLGGGFGGIGGRFDDLFDFLNPGGGGSSLFDIVKKALAAFFKAAGEDNVLKKPLEQFFKTLYEEGSNILEKPLQEFLKSLVNVSEFRNEKPFQESLPFFAAFLEAAVKFVVKFSAEITGHVSVEVGVGGSLEGAFKELTDAIGGLIKSILDALTKLLNDVQNNFPIALTSGPLEALGAIQGIKTLLTDLHYLENIEARIEAASSSLLELFKVLAKPSSPNEGDDDDIPFLLLGQVVKQSTAVIKGLLHAKTPQDALVEVIKDLVFPTDVFVRLLKTAKDGKFWAWAELPSALPAGALNEWLNNPDRYPNGLKSTLDREFRVRMVAAADAYVRGRLNDPDRPFTQTLTLTNSDERDSGNALADAVCLFFDTIIHFILEPECFPLTDIDLYSIEDLGIRFGQLLAREIRISIRALIGLVLRGFWGITVGNYVLIELIAVIIAVFFSAMIEAVIRNLTWSLQIVSCYPSALFDGSPTSDTAPVDPKLDGAQLVYYWPSAETIANTGEVPDRLWYVAMVRAPGVTLPSGYPKRYKQDDGTDEWRAVTGLLRDFGAYLDTCYQRFRIESRFPKVEAADEVTITRAEIAGRTLTVWATTTATFEEPQPILRAYFCCRVVPLRPGPFAGDPYTVEIDIEQAPRCIEVIVLSNRGGVARRRAVRGGMA